MALRLRFCSRASATSSRPRADVWFRSQTTDLGQAWLQSGWSSTRLHPTPLALSIHLASQSPAFAPPHSAPPLSPVSPPRHALLPSDPAHRSLVLTRSALASILAPVSPMALPLISSAVRLGLVPRARSRTLEASFRRDSATDRDCRGWSFLKNKTKQKPFGFGISGQQGGQVAGSEGAGVTGVGPLLRIPHGPKNSHSRHPA